MAAAQLVNYLAAARDALGCLPTRERIVLERFFDETGDMHLVVHAPLGSRLMRAWGLALRKRFCRQFNFELQAAATDDGELTITITGGDNEEPEANADSYATDVDVPLIVDAATGVLANDSDADGEPVYFNDVSQTSEKGGTVTRDGTWIYYMPAAGFTNVDRFTYTISDSRGTPVTGTVTVELKPEDGAARNLSITDLGNSAYRLRFSGIPNRATIIQYTPVLEPPDWQTLTTGTSDEVGIFEYIDTPPGGARQAGEQPAPVENR